MKLMLLVQQQCAFILKLNFIKLNQTRLSVMATTDTRFYVTQRALKGKS